MADNLTFATIPIDWRVPGANIEIDPSRSVRNLLASMFRTMLVIGQRLSTGIIPAGVAVDITRKEDGINYFGRGSMLAQQIEAILKVNPYTRLKAIALDDSGAGNAAAGTLTFTGGPTESGTLYLMIGGRAVNVGITASQTVTQIAANTVAAITADLDGAVTATSAAGVVTVTSRHKGTEGNSIDIRTNYYAGQTMPKGLALAIVAMTGGSGNPDVTAVITAMNSLPAYSILSGWTDAANITLLESELVSRWGGMQMRQGHVFGFVNGTYSGLTTYGSARNSPHSSFLGLNKSPTLPWVISAQWGAAVEMSGGIDPAIPFKGIYLPDVMAPDEKLRFLSTERNLLLHDGISTVTFDQSGGCYVEQVITTYQTNAFSMEDVSLLKLNTKWTVDYMAFVFKADILATFPRHKLAEDDVLQIIQAGQKIATPKLIRDCLIATAMKLARAGLLEDIEGFIRDVKVVISDVDKNRVNVILPPNIVNQFDVFAAAIQFVL